MQNSSFVSSCVDLGSLAFSGVEQQQQRRRPSVFCYADMNASSSMVGKRKADDIYTSSADCWDDCLPGLKRFHPSSSSGAHDNSNAMDSTSGDQYLDDDFIFVGSEAKQLHPADDQKTRGPEQLSSDHSTLDQIKCLDKQPTILQEGSSQTDLEELLENLLTEETQDIFQAVPPVGMAATTTAAMADLDSEFSQAGIGSSNASLYRGPSLTDVKSALSVYSGDQDHVGLSALDMSSASVSSSSSLLFNSLPGDDLRPYSSESWLSPNTATSGIMEDVISEGAYGSFSNSINALFYKRLQKARNDPKYSLKIKNSDGAAVDDGYKWRKYGQKAIKNSPHPRSYYRCTNPRCCAKKQVERSAEDPETITITYEGLHLHYSYSQIQLRQTPSYYQHHPLIKEEKSQHKLMIENAFINVDEISNGSSHALSINRCGDDCVSTQAIDSHHHRRHQQPPHEQPSLEICESSFDGHCDMFGGHINGVVEENGGLPGRGDGLLQDILPLGLINPLSFPSSSSSSSFSPSP